MNSAGTSILAFLEGSKQFVIPIYQRMYEWKREQMESSDYQGKGKRTCEKNMRNMGVSRVSHSC